MNNNLPTVQEIQSLEAIAKTAAKTTYFGNLTPEQVMMMFYVANDLNLPRSVVLAKGLNVINGSVEISARVMNMLIRRNGHAIRLIACNDAGCKLWGKRKDTGEEMEVTYTIEDAKKARLIRPGGGWEKNPSDMCFARAISRLARRLFPDCVGNCYIEGEVSERASKEAVEAPDLSDLEIEVKEEPEIAIPPDVDREKVNAYLKELEDTFQGAVNFKERAAKNPEEFWKKFHEWNYRVAV